MSDDKTTKTEQVNQAFVEVRTYLNTLTREMVRMAGSVMALDDNASDADRALALAMVRRGAERTAAAAHAYGDELTRLAETVDAAMPDAN